MFGPKKAQTYPATEAKNTDAIAQESSSMGGTRPVTQMAKSTRCKGHLAHGRKHFENMMFSMTNAVAEIADIELGLFAATSRWGATLATGRRRSANGNIEQMEIRPRAGI